MFNTVFKGLFDTADASTIEIVDFLLCLGCSLIIGLVLALSYMYRTRYTKSFVMTLALLPAVVCIVIMMVNGSVGAGIAVAGAFGLVRFRSAPGTAKEIAAIFLAMGSGLIAGMGYLAYALLFALIMCGFFVLYDRLDFGCRKNDEKYKTIHITIPEDLDYSDVFTDIFERYTKSCTLAAVKTTNMGSMFRLTYDAVLKDPASEKKLIDELRCRNGNLEITVSRQSTEHGTEL